MFSPSSNSEDAVASTLAKISRNILICTFGLLPLFVVPIAFAPFGFSKVLLMVIGVFAAVIFYSLAALRTGSIEIKKSFLFLTPWFVALSVALSAVLSGDAYDSFIGDGFGVHTAFFVGLIALVVSAVPIIGRNKNSLMTLYIVLTGVAFLLGMYHVLRLFLGVDFLSFGLFPNETSTPLGGWNDLAIFFGLSLLLALVAIEQLPLTKIGRWAFVVVLVIALIILAVINFSAIWFVLGFVSLAVLMYALTKNRFKNEVLLQEYDSSEKNLYSIVLSAAVFLFSLAFIIGGPVLSGYISEVTNISHVEVRPSFSATMDIARGVYGENTFTGIGANKFSDAWRLYKDTSINQTIYWGATFNSGIGYLPTFVVTTGIVGTLAWLVCMLSIIYAGIRILFVAKNVDRFWYFMGTSSFVASLYLWGVSCLYVPGPTIIFFAAIFTGILFTTYITVVEQRTLSVAFGENRRSGFVLVILTMILIIGSVSTVYFVSKQYSGQYAFNRALASVSPGVSIEQVEQDMVGAYNLSRDDRFLREVSSLQLAKMNTLLAVQNPTDAQTQQYRTALARAVESGERAVAIDSTDSLNWQILATIYSTAIVASGDEAYERTYQALEMASTLDPKNPEIKLQFAQMESRSGNLDSARAFALEAIQLKNNYPEAYLSVAQIDIARGDVAAAIQSASAIALLEPQNPARYYQLGVLYASISNLEGAVRSFEQAVSLDPSYANARYFLALTYSELGRIDDAKVQLEIVQDLNPGNEVLAELLGQLESGESIGQVTGASPINENETESVSDTTLEGQEVPDSPLLTPVNGVPVEDEVVSDESEPAGIAEDVSTSTEDQ